MSAYHIHIYTYILALKMHDMLTVSHLIRNSKLVIKHMLISYILSPNSSQYMYMYSVTCTCIHVAVTSIC